MCLIDSLVGPAVLFSCLSIFDKQMHAGSLALRNPAQHFDNKESQLDSTACYARPRVLISNQAAQHVLGLALPATPVKTLSQRCNLTCMIAWASRHLPLGATATH